MDSDYTRSVLEVTRERFHEMVADAGLLKTGVSVLAKPLTPEEAIGTPGRRDFPIITGKERVVEAAVLGAKGHAFTDSPREFTGTLKDVLELDLDSNQNRAIYIATLNATLNYLGMATGTLHCKDDDPEKCAADIASTLVERYGKVRVGLIGLNPAIAERLAEVFGVDRLRITDLNNDNIGKRRFGVEVWDGKDRTEDLIDASDVIVVTGTTLVNGTFDRIRDRIESRGKAYVVFGVTTAGVSSLTGIERICPYGRSE
jgi:uncharacterized protein (DUF4213/DUF364 family)